jgi:hypothetical protein
MRLEIFYDNGLVVGVVFLSLICAKMNMIKSKAIL